jgi:electron transport complex protein RnfG
MKRTQMFKLGLILAVYCIVGCVGLAFVYNGTSKTIAQRQQADLQAGLKEVFPKATSFKPTDKVKSTNPKIVIDEAYLAIGSTGTMGTAVKAHGPSYGGDTTLIVGVSTDGTITGVKILENKDTPGLGANAANPSYYVNKATKTTFAGQFAGKKLTDEFVVKKDVLAITSATITSRSITSIVQTVAKASADALGIGGSEQDPKAVLPEADTIRPAATPMTAPAGVTVLDTSVGTKGGTVVGAVATAKAKSYDGDVTVMVGVATDGTITGIKVVTCTDSLGSSILTADFAKQFVGRKAGTPLTVGTNVDAVTGATFSSKGATALVQQVADALAKALAGGGL